MPNAMQRYSHARRTATIVRIGNTTLDAAPLVREPNRERRSVLAVIAACTWAIGQLLS
jgi:hypothetical protein